MAEGITKRSFKSYMTSLDVNDRALIHDDPEFRIRRDSFDDGVALLFE
jgi:hypothetical protein